MIVQAIGKINFQGNIVPMSWLEHIKTEAGKPDAIGALVLADIVYWYRPTEVRDEATGRVVGYKQKFAADKLQRSYDQLADQFGFSKNQVRRAIKRLENAGLITTEFRTVETAGGLKIGNVMFVEPVPERLAEITLSIPMNKFVDRVSTNLSIGVDEFVDTYTETTTETTTDTPGRDIQQAESAPPPTIEEVILSRDRYTDKHRKVIRDYWDTVRWTRKTGRIAPSVVDREMEYWEAFPVPIVIEALTIHTERYPYKQEDYTRGIVRRLTKERESPVPGDVCRRSGTVEDTETELERTRRKRAALLGRQNDEDATALTGS